MTQPDKPTQALTRDVLDGWLSDLSTYGRGDDQWTPTPDAFKSVCRMALASLPSPAGEKDAVLQEVETDGVSSPRPGPLAVTDEESSRPAGTAPHAEPGEGQEPEVFGWCESAEVQGEGQRCSHQCVSCFRAEYQPYVDSLRATVARLRVENSSEYQRGRKDEQAAKLNADFSWKQRAEQAERRAEAMRQLLKRVLAESGGLRVTLANDIADAINAAHQQDKP